MFLESFIGKHLILWCVQSRIFSFTGWTPSWTSSRALYHRALEGRERTLGPDHKDTLISVGNMAALLKAQGKFDEAELMYRRTMESRERTLGPADFRFIDFIQ